MNGAVDFLQWLCALNPATVFAVVVILATAGLSIWWLYCAWLRRRDQRQWTDGYHSGILVGRRQERVEAIGDSIRDDGMGAVVRFYNSLDREMPGHGTQPKLP